SPGYVAPYEQAMAHVGHVLDALRAMTASDRPQRIRLERVARLVGRRLAILEATLVVRKRDGFEAARRMVGTERGKTVMEAIRRALGSMARAERLVLAKRAAAARASGRRAIWIMLFGDVAAVVFA